MLDFVSAEEPLVPSKIVAKMDVIGAMEAVEDASGKYTPRKKTPPSGSQDEKKRLIRELGKGIQKQRHT
jgi:hypothetical protein